MKHPWNQDRPSQGWPSTLIGWSVDRIRSFASPLPRISDSGFNPIVILRSILWERHDTAPRFRSALFQLFIRCGACARTRGLNDKETREEARQKCSRSHFSYVHNSDGARPMQFAVFQQTYSNVVSVSSIIALDISQSNTTRAFRHVMSSCN